MCVCVCTFVCMCLCVKEIRVSTKERKRVYARTYMYIYICACACVVCTLSAFFGNQPALLKFSYAQQLALCAALTSMTPNQATRMRSSQAGLTCSTTSMASSSLRLHHVYLSRQPQGLSNLPCSTDLEFREATANKQPVINEGTNSGAGLVSVSVATSYALIW